MDSGSLQQGHGHRFGACSPIAMMIGAWLCGSSFPRMRRRTRLRDVFFGETHLHTSWSFDAYVFGNTHAGPEEAYQYALGKPIKHPGGYMVQIKRPLDFAAVTDHAEYMGTVRLANDPQSDLSKLPIAEKLKVRSREDIQKVYLFLGASSIKNEPIKELISPEVAGSVWKRVVEIADKYNQPGKFTTFAAYEWSSTPDNRNLHRNILFKDTKKVPSVPFSSIDSDQPGGAVEVDGWPAQGGERGARDLAQRQPVRRRHVSAGSRQQGPADRRGVGAVAREQRAADRDSATQGRIGDAPRTVTQRRVRRARNSGVPAWAASIARRGCTAATSARPTRTARRCRTRAGTTRTSSASSVPAIRTIPRVIYAVEFFRRPRPARRHAARPG